MKKMFMMAAAGVLAVSLTACGEPKECDGKRKCGGGEVRSAED